MVLACLALITAQTALLGFEARDCPDWGFHACYACGGTAVACSNGAYSHYPSLVHDAAAGLSGLTSLPAQAWLIGFFVVAVLVVGALLLHFVGVFKFFVFFAGVPALLLAAGVSSGYWFNGVFCGQLSFWVAFAFFSLLMFRGFKGLLLTALFLAVLVSVHAYGWVLALLFLASCVAAWFFRWYLPSNFEGWRVRWALVFIVLGLFVVVSPVFGVGWIGARLLVLVFYAGCAFFGQTS